MRWLIFFIILLFCSNLFAQTQEKAKRYKIDEFGNVPEKVWKAKFYKLFQQQPKNCENEIIVITYGLKQSTIEKYLKYLLRQKCGYESLRMGLGKENAKSPKTEIWLVPSEEKHQTQTLKTNLKL